ncbi:uncharacterized protein LOC134265964 [Saccostrea cucullata]|uniref:uncharacterized protein LOC134265964 n=1 Tax=Saccostrea cuccullata TaxID=36930 RepID=UPI002ED07170
MNKMSTIVFCICCAIFLFSQGADANACTFTELAKCSTNFGLPLFTPKRQICSLAANGIACVERVNSACLSSRHVPGSSDVHIKGLQILARMRQRQKDRGCVSGVGRQETSVFVIVVACLFALNFY